MLERKDAPAAPNGNGDPPMADATSTEDITDQADIPALPEPHVRERPAHNVSGGLALLGAWPDSRAASA
ncbi:hypothetical protein SANT12839_060270 [Streptomyces antimycoticus]|uniref:Uncharacterized protein n=2 Tax=Streptomyces antimycoticus TaxID=68175 RepID=A0A4D4K864_9ACTN|nr:hypothetical protein SANT12839_060270 [Streptomyces antimycoticus]